MYSLGDENGITCIISCFSVEFCAKCLPAVVLWRQGLGSRMQGARAANEPVASMVAAIRTRVENRAFLYSLLLIGRSSF